MSENKVMICRKPVHAKWRKMVKLRAKAVFGPWWRMVEGGFQKLIMKQRNGWITISFWNECSKMLILVPFTLYSKQDLKTLILSSVFRNKVSKNCFYRLLTFVHYKLLDPYILFRHYSGVLLVIVVVPHSYLNSVSESWLVLCGVTWTYGINL